jgi:hypothetical protein
MHALRTRHQSHASQRETPPSPPVPGKTGRKRRSRLAKPAAAILPRVALLRPGSPRLVGRGTVNRRTSAPAAAFGREMTQTCVGSTDSRSISWWLELSHTTTCRSVELRWWHSRTSRSGEPPADHRRSISRMRQTGTHFVQKPVRAMLPCTRCSSSLCALYPSLPFSRPVRPGYRGRH